MAKQRLLVASELLKSNILVKISPNDNDSTGMYRTGEYGLESDA